MRWPISATGSSLPATLLLYLLPFRIFGILVGRKHLLQLGIHGFLTLLHLFLTRFTAHLLPSIFLLTTRLHLLTTLQVKIIYRFILGGGKSQFLLQVICLASCHLFRPEFTMSATLRSLRKQTHGKYHNHYGQQSSFHLIIIN